MGAAGALPGWILTKHQTAGRGSRGRDWLSDPGNFAASLLFRPDTPPATAALRSFTAALALAHTFEALGLEQAAITLKWPNDVLVQGRKSAGILLESSGIGDQLSYLIVGIGVNLNSSPPKEALRKNALAATSLSEHLEQVPTPEQFLDYLAPTFDVLEQRLVNFGFDSIRLEWLGRAANVKQIVTIQSGREMLCGMIETLDDTGALVLATEKGRRVISTGEIFFTEATPNPILQQS